MLAQPSEFFAALSSRFRTVDGWHLLGAWHDEQLLAATLYLRWRDRLYYKFNASDADGLAFRPNNILVWAGVLLAKELGCSALDLGPSDDDQPGLIRFKRGFGPVERELRFLKWTPPGAPSEQGVELRGVLSEVTRLLASPAVPDDVTNSARSAYALSAVCMTKPVVLVTGATGFVGSISSGDWCATERRCMRCAGRSPISTGCKCLPSHSVPISSRSPTGRG